MYYRVHQALAEKISLPNLIVYLRADTETLMQRITVRDRTYERNMDKSYIEELNQVYDHFFADSHHQGVPVLRIDTDNINYIRNSEDLQSVESRIRQALRLSPFQPELPLGVD
jgi:deoxyguanosine kinase